MKILQVTDTTLVVGVDIAKEIQFARAFNYRGVELICGDTGPLEFTNDIDGFEFFAEWIDGLKDSYGLDSVLVGMEPTGHYWFNLRQDCEARGIDVVLVNPYHVSLTNELDDNSPGKNDAKAPRTIAKLVIDGRYVEYQAPKGVYAELREVMTAYEHAQKSLVAAKNMIIQWTDRFFPEINNVFDSLFGKTALVTLSNFPLPSMVLELGAQEVLTAWKRTIPRGVGIKRAGALVEAASKSVGSKEGVINARASLTKLLAEYHMHESNLTSCLGDMEALLGEIPHAGKLVAIKGVGLVTVAGFFAEAGDISRFDSPEQLIKYAGLNIVEKSSGKHKGKAKISKRGRKRLRALLYRVAIAMVKHNPEFRELHRYYTKRADNPLKKTQSLVALCCKMIRVAFVILTRGVDYSGEKLISDIRRSAGYVA
jgi:transposase